MSRSIYIYTYWFPGGKTNSASDDIFRFQPFLQQTVYPESDRHNSWQSWSEMFGNQLLKIWLLSFEADSIVWSPVYPCILSISNYCCLMSHFDPPRCPIPAARGPSEPFVPTNVAGSRSTSAGVHDWSHGTRRPLQPMTGFHAAARGLANHWKKGL